MEMKEKLSKLAEDVVELDKQYHKGKIGKDEVHKALVNMTVFKYDLEWDFARSIVYHMKKKIFGD